MTWNPFKQKKKSRVDELREQIDRADWLREIERTRGYALLLTLIQENARWIERQLTICTAAELQELQADYKAVKTWEHGLSRWDAEGKKAREILFGRVERWEQVFETAQPNQEGVKPNA